MAAHTAIFELEGAKAQVQRFSYGFSRSVDGEKGYPTKVVRSGTIVLKIRSDEKTMKGSVIKWMNDQDIAKSGSITIYKDANQQKELKKVKFERGYVINYQECFGSDEDSKNTEESFEIAAEKITVEGVTFDMKFPDDD